MSARRIVSVVLPVFNGGSLFGRAVESILAQDLADFELIVIDDGSTDETPTTAQRFAQRDPRVRVILHAQNQGVAATLNEGVRLAQAPLVARMDADDESLPHRLTTQVAFLDDNPDIAVCGSYVYHMGARPKFDRLVTLPMSWEEVHDTLRSYNCLYHPTVMFRKAVIDGLGGYRGEFVNAEDYELWLRVSRHHRVCNISEPLLRYRFSLSGATLGRKWQQLYYVYLAQIIGSDPTLPLAQARARADALLRDTDRKYFFGEVAKGTVNELLQLRRWRDAARLVVLFENEIASDVMHDLTLQVLRAAVPEARLA